MKKNHHQKQIQIEQLDTSNLSSLNFILKSIYLTIFLTLPPISTLVVIWELQLITPVIMISWVMFALFWTFYVLLSLSKKIIE